MTTKRGVLDATRARGALAIDPKTNQGAWDSPPERVCAWDEDATTLAVDAALALARAPLAVLGPGIDAATFAAALDLPKTLTASDPMAVAKAMNGRVLAVGAPDASSAIAALVDETDASDPTAPRDVSPPALMVSALRALQEARRIPPEQPMPDTPMGAYVPMGTWMEDIAARLRLEAQRCTACAKLLFPPRGACPACRGREFEPVPLPREATVYAATRIGRGGAPSEFALEQAQVGAYWVAVVEWPEQGVRVSARLTHMGDDEVHIGMPVRAVIRRLFDQEGTTRYGVKFAPTR